MMDSWYGWPDRKEAVREYKYPIGNYGAREWPIGWIAIDGDEVIEHEGQPVVEEEKMEEDHTEKKEIRKVCRSSLLCVKHCLYVCIVFADRILL